MSNFWIQNYMIETSDEKLKIQMNLKLKKKKILRNAKAIEIGL